MAKRATTSRFKTKLFRPAKPGKGKPWSFLVLPKKVSDTLPRRGRTSIAGELNGHASQATLEPDGQLSHWLKIDEVLRQAAGVEIGDMVALELAPVETDPEPQVPADLRKALAASPKAKTVWDDTTAIARVDWIHWIVSAK